MRDEPVRRLMAKKTMQAGRDLLLRVERAFLDHGYSELSMIGLARACELSPRALYYYFSGKEEAFRAAVQFRNSEAIGAALAAGRTLRATGGGALDILAKIMDARYGETRRALNLSPHIVELNAEAFKRCQDNMIASAIHFQKELSDLIVDFQAAHLLRVKDGVAPEQIAQALADGARGVNQRLPPIASDALPLRYRDMCAFVLYGSARAPG
jgi:AcrR family transcriptional regulator